MKQIDEAGYKDGQTAFAKGKSLRSVFEPIIKLANAPYEDRVKEEDKANYHNSAMLGFADALITKLRSR